jgi:hypothetical protein
MQFPSFSSVLTKGLLVISSFRNITAPTCPEPQDFSPGPLDSSGKLRYWYSGASDLNATYALQPRPKEFLSAVFMTYNGNRSRPLNTSPIANERIEGRIFACIYSIYNATTAGMKKWALFQGANNANISSSGFWKKTKQIGENTERFDCVSSSNNVSDCPHELTITRHAYTD